ncbi:MAG: CAP domain-containing protein [Hyphomicrobiales bacterium]|nr:CAP domain-containing protein [Hyphomicrobiales bacterium]
MRRRAVHGLILLLAILGPTAAAAQSVHADLLALINRARADHGLAALRANGNLDVAARGHAADMAVNDFLSHVGSDHRTLGDRVAATGYAFAYVSEALAAGPRTAAQAVHLWLTSAAHRDLLLSPDAREVGLAAAPAPITSTHGTYWAAVFGRRFGEK